MTIVVTNIVAGPFTATGAEQEVAFDFKVFTREEVEVVYGSDRTAIDPDTYVVEPNRTIDGQVLEGGTITLLAGALPAGTMFNAVAKPAKTQELVFSDTGSRLRNLNEVADRAALRAIRAQYDGALEGAGAELIEAATEAGASAGAAAALNKADKNLLNVVFTRSDDDAVPVDEPDYRGAQPRRPIEFGATPQETAYDTDLDNTAELQAMIDGAFSSGATLPGLPGGGIVIIDKVYRINAPLYMRKWVTLEGIIQGGELLDHDKATNSNADKTATTLGAVPGTIICGPSGKIVPKDCCHLDKIRIISDELAKVSPNGNEAALRAQIVRFLDYEIAIDPVFGACDVSVTNCFIAGFELACRFDYTERYRFNLNKVDCVNGLFVTDIYDHSEINFNSFWPYGIAHRLGSGGETLATAYGTAIKFGKNPASDRSTDGGTVIGNMIYGYSYGLDLEATNALHVAFNWIDNNRARADTQDTTGIRMSGNCRRTKLIANHVDSYGRSYDIQADGGVIFNDNTSAGCTYSHLRVGPSVILIGGTFFMQDYVTGQGGDCIELNDSHVQVVFDRLVFAGCGGSAVSTLTSVTAIMNFRVSKFSSILPHASFVPLNPDQYTSVVSVSRTSDAALSGNNVDNTISFPNTLLDGFSEWTGSNTMTVKRAGWYMIDVNLLATPPNTSAGLMQAYLRVNSAGVRVCSIPHSGHTNPMSFTLNATPIYLSTNDQVTVTLRSLINASFNLKGDLCVFTARFVERP
jgi:hypothetical protein